MDLGTLCFYILEWNNKDKNKMKLLFCPICWDIFKLETELRTCKCGEVKGKYLEDGHKAVVNGKGLSLAISVYDMAPALWKVREGKTYTIECWARPHDGGTNPNTTVDRSL